MKIDVITIFPEMFESIFDFGIIHKARQAGTLELNCLDLRNFAADRHRMVDDRPFGGGAGMVFKPEPLAAAIRSRRDESASSWTVYLSPQGHVLNQTRMRALADKDHLILICGRYEGIDQRIIDLFVDEELSIGDYILSGGEIPAMVLVDGIVRCLPGVVGHPASTRDESFETGLLDYPVYTRPAEFEGLSVPEVLLSGDHREIARWRRLQAREKTRRVRPDLLDQNEQ
ncbi:MAG: tRNA (guanosine(37)-N1)-methyltransferase TrmD [Acidobacteria bacterium]|nr:tRNA (guanosine(37)-N1)-methyltransferase TrmD [Acidobacteriota bacterium]